MPDLLCLGEPLFEFSSLGEGRWRDGVGGDVSNVAIAAARQGARSGVVSRLGCDQFGTAIRALWEREGVDHRFVADDPEAPTGLYFIHHDDDGHHFSYRRAGSAASLMASEILAATNGPFSDPLPQILHTSGITMAIGRGPNALALEAAKRMVRAGRKVSYDPNLRLNLTTLDAARADQVTMFAAGAQIALPGLDDAQKLTGKDDPADIVAEYHRLGAEIVALTLGPHGALISTLEGCHKVAPRPAKLVDASGAGDCFDGAFLARILKGHSPEDAGEYAVMAASLSVQGHGAVAPIPYRDDVEKALTAPRR